MIVAGGGPGGIPAAVRGARAKTLLIERYGYLEEWQPRADCGHSGHASGAPEVPMIGGIAEELCRRMTQLGGAPDYDEAVKRGGIAFHPEAFKLAADEIVLSTDADLRLHTWVADAIVEDDRIVALVLESKSGREAVAGKVFVDATGDADVVARAGAGFTFGRDFDHAVRRWAACSTSRAGRSVCRRRAGGHPARASRRCSGEINAIIRCGRCWRTLHWPPSAQRQRFAGTRRTRGPHARRVTGAARYLGAAGWWRKHVPGMEEAFLVQTPAHIGLARAGR